ncbi:ribbon-helix-helix domain-containing protein [Dyella solisilvae]|nr:type II toxin-antitoxin system ParD family antitoxin [Dyella solisilvae]
MTRPTKQLSITLPIEMVDLIASKVRTGEYASESEVIRHGLRMLMAHDRAVENWLQSEVAVTYDTIKADPSKAISPADLRARLAKLRTWTTAHPRQGDPK